MFTEMRTALQTTPEKKVGQWVVKFVTQIIHNE